MSGAAAVGRARRLVESLCLGSLSGALVVAARPPDGTPWLVLGALVPLLVALRRGCWASAAAAGAACGLLVYAVGIPSMAPVAARLQGVSATAAHGFAVGFIAYHAVQFALAALAVGWLWRRPRNAPPGVAAALAAAATWVLVEWAFPQMLPWALGALLGPLAAPRQIAALGGAHLLTFAVVLVNALLAAALLRARRDGLRAVGCAGLAAGLLLAVWGGGALAARRDAGGEWPRLRVAGVQGGLSAGGELGAAAARAWQTYASLTRPLAGRAELTVWPESTLRLLLREQHALLGHVRSLAAAIRMPLLLGALDRGPQGGGGERNAALLVVPGDVPLQAYHKLRLVPFGEYVPALVAWLPGWRRTGELEPGTTASLLRVPPGGSPGGQPLAAGAAICFEAIVPGWYNRLVRDGAQVLLNLSDDAWFADARVAAQHLEMTRLRAVETRRWLVRVSNSGSSAVIDPRGEIVALLPFGESGKMVQAVEARDDRSPYVRGGNWIVALSAALVTARRLSLRWAR